MSEPGRNPFSVKAIGLREYLAPVCDCPLVPIPCRCPNCLVGKPCHRWVIYESCHHVQRMSSRDEGDNPLTAAEAGDLLSVWLPADYAEPRLPDMPGLRNSREAEENLFYLRANGSRRQGLRHPLDVVAREVDCLSEVGELGMRRAGLMTPTAWARRMLAREEEALYRGPLDRLAEHAVKRTPPGKAVEQPQGQGHAGAQAPSNPKRAAA